MYCLIQFYIQLKDDLAPHRPFLKVLCIKLVIFFCFWQSLIISFLTGESGPLKASDKIAGPDLRIGIPSMLTCVEMAIFAVLHLFAFPWKPYDLGRRHEPLPQGGGDAAPEALKTYARGPARALLSAFNPWDIIKATGRGLRWLFVGARHRKNDPSYHTKLEPMSNKDTRYHGPTFAGNGEAAVEIAKPGKQGSEESDTSGLLSYAQANPFVSPQDPGAYNGGYDGYRPGHGLAATHAPRQEYGVMSPPTQQNPFSDYESQHPNGISHWQPQPRFEGGGAAPRPGGSERPPGNYPPPGMF